MDDLENAQYGHLILGIATVQGLQKVCARCRSRKKRCDYIGRSSSCDACAKDRAICSLSPGNLVFAATQFAFRHALGSKQDHTENQPGIRLADTRQYYYIEWPYETGQPWSPLYLRQEFENSGGLLRRTFPGSFFGRDNKRLEGYNDMTETAIAHEDYSDRLSPFVACPVSPEVTTQVGLLERKWLAKAWLKHHEGNDRPQFQKQEQVLTCRRIVRVQGILDTNDQPQAVQFQPGHYKIRWRFQHFDTCPRTRDFTQLFHLRDLDSGLTCNFAKYRNSEGSFNPMAFPWWDKLWPDYPGVATLELHVGYRKYPKSVLSYDTHGLSARDTASEVLFSHEEMKLAYTASGSLRSVVKVHSRGALRMSDRGWLHVPDWLAAHADEQRREEIEAIEAGEQRPLTDWDAELSKWITVMGTEDFEVLPGLQPVFIVQNVHAGKWQGGFRFGGVELVPVKTSSTVTPASDSAMTDEILPDAS